MNPRGQISSLLMAGDANCDMTKSCTIRFVLRLGNVTKTFESEVTTMKGFAMVSDHHFNSWRYTIYVEGYVLVFRMNIATYEYGFVHPFTIRVLFFVGILLAVAKIPEKFPK